MAATANYEVLENINHDNQSYPPGSIIALTEEQAQILLKLTPPVIKLSSVKTPTPKT